MNIKKNGEYDEKVVENLILSLLDKKEFQTVKELIEVLKTQYFIPREISLKIIKKLEEKDEISLKKREPKYMKTQCTVKDIYLFNKDNLDFWAPFIIGICGILSTLFISSELFPLNILRWIFGGIFVIFLPGYSLTQIIFLEKNLDEIKIIALSVGLSLFSSSLVAFILNFTLGITITLLLVGLSFVFFPSLFLGKYLKVSRKLKVQNYK